MLINAIGDKGRRAHDKIGEQNQPVFNHDIQTSQKYDRDRRRKYGGPIARGARDAGDDCPDRLRPSLAALFQGIADHIADFRFIPVMPDIVDMQKNIAAAIERPNETEPPVGRPVGDEGRCLGCKSLLFGSIGRR